MREQIVKKQETERLFIATYIGITSSVFLSFPSFVVQARSTGFACRSCIVFGEMTVQSCKRVIVGDDGGCCDDTLMSCRSECAVGYGVLGCGGDRRHEEQAHQMIAYNSSFTAWVA